MTMYRAKTLSKSLNDGMLKAIVVFTSDADIVTQTFETTQYQEGWLENQIEKKLILLNKLKKSLASIELDKNIVERAKSVQLAKDIYEQDIILFTQFVAAIRSGFTTESNPEFVALKDKLTLNFTSDYLDLF